MKITSPRILDILAVLTIVSVVLFSWLSSPALAVDEVDTGTASEATAVRVEIQRYMGYEALLMRYLSLPYDLTMNTNEQLALLDTGFLLLIFVPIIMLLGFRQRPWLQWAVILPCFFLLVISTANGFIVGTDIKAVPAEAQALGDYLAATSFSDAPAGVFTAWIYKQCLPVYQVLEVALSGFLGDKDRVTYPFLLIIFTLLFYLSWHRFSHRNNYEQGLLVLIFGYSFFWLILSSGIVWYGYLVFPVFTALLFRTVPGLKKNDDLTTRVVRYGFFSLVGISLLLGFTQRLSNINMSFGSDDPLAGQRLYDPAYLKYQTGNISANQVIDEFYPQMSRAIQEINRESESLIYNVGTRFNFFIRENDTRIFKDNQLDLFQQLQEKHRSKERVTALLKNAGFRYIMVDFNTPSGDNTPEQVLVTKFKKFLILLYENPGLELIATNRVISETVNGQKRYRYDVFGDIQEFGSYAVYRIK